MLAVIRVNTSTLAGVEHPAAPSRRPDPASKLVGAVVGLLQQGRRLLASRAACAARLSRQPA